MKTMGIKELKKNLSEVLREVEESGQTVAVSNRGRIVARLIPAQSARTHKRDSHATIVDIATLAAQIGADLPAAVSVKETINDIRR